MRQVTAVTFAIVLLFFGRASAQEFTEYQNIPDGFKVDFPGQPRVTQATWTAEHDYVLPSHVYSADRGREHYSVTVVDYNLLQKMGEERVKKCPVGAEPCIGSDLSGPSYWKHVIRGAIVDASARFLKRDVTITSYMWNHQDLIEGHQLQLTNRADQSRTFVFIAMRENKLYVVEGTVPKGYPEPALFQNSMGFLDKDGRGVRYQTIYSNTIYGLGDREPPTYGGGGGARGGGAGRGRGAGQGGGGQ